MDFESNPEQQAVLEAVESLLSKHAGPQRAIELAAAGGYDEDLDAALEEAGFGELASAMGRLEAVLLVEAVSRHAGVAAVGARALALPAVSLPAAPGPIALLVAGHAGPVRFAAHARTLLVVDGSEVRQVDVPPGACPPVASNFGYPMGRVPSELASGGRAVGSGLGPTLVDAWRLALAAETTGAMEAALDQTVEYLKERRQFGKTIGSFQAVQHRLAECAIQLEASRWLCREAAFHADSSEAIAIAAAFALDAAGHLFAETHQLSGAIGFTREHDLHVWSMRLHALRQELGGVAQHRRAVVDARWSGSRV